MRKKEPPPHYCGEGLLGSPPMEGLGEVLFNLDLELLLELVLASLR